jgi:hypothetical protein
MTAFLYTVKHRSEYKMQRSAENFTETTSQGQVLTYVQN